MNYFLTEEQQMIVDTAREIAVKKIIPVREKYDHEGIFPWDIVKALSEADLCGLYIPEEYGGYGGGVFELCLAVEELSKIDGGISLAMAATALGTFPILLHATPEQKKKYLPDIAAGKSIAAFGLTEANAGSDALGMKTTAVLDGNEWVINGTKQWITNGENAKVYTVFAKTDPSRGARGISCFIIEKGTPGFTFGKHEDKMGIRASSTTELVFQDCRIPKDALLGGREGMGSIVAIHTLNNSRPGVGSQALGIAAGALDDAVKYSRERVQFGSPISSFQAVQHMLADMATEVEAARALLYATARWVDDLKKTGSKESFAKESAMTKLFCSDVAMRVTVDALQVMGGYGYMKEYPMEKRMRDAKITQIYEGTNQIQRNEIALQLIKEAAA
ncbi:MAG: acyl-CoA dehydrogenase family protein [Chitinispirillia bacterium]|nr:acyl-CoA dehydrogenase family protein [Chitinispirillia bacterium]MCL2241485.1 acyl-CoA dehydrogenase family protein [Chitinispirillia bacterium]